MDNEEKAQQAPVVEKIETPQKPSGSHKKWIFIIGGLVILFLPLIVTMLLQTRDNSDMKVTLSPTIVQEVKNPLSEHPAASVANLQKWIKYEGKSFTLEYAPDWSLENGTVVGEGESVIIKPQALPQDASYPNFILQTEAFSEDRSTQRLQLFKSLGLKESEITLFGISADKISGTIPFKKAGTQIIKQPIQETMIQLVKGQTTYVFKYAYEGDKVNPDLEKYFTEFIEGIKLR